MVAVMTATPGGPTADLERLGLCYERFLVAPLPPTSDVETARVARLNAPTTLSPLASREADR
jgi:hypothetical protein